MELIACDLNYKYLIYKTAFKHGGLHLDIGTILVNQFQPDSQFKTLMTQSLQIFSLLLLRPDQGLRDLQKEIEGLTHMRVQYNLQAEMNRKHYMYVVGLTSWVCDPSVT